MDNKKYCSWCFEESSQSLIARNTFTRDLYQCDNCGNETCCCMSCKLAVTRRYQENSDKLCFKCKFLIISWDVPPKKQKILLSTKGRCSWCFNITSHSLFKHNTAQRSEYVCNDCDGRTISCRTCSSMARNHLGLGDQRCVKCQNIIKDWDNPYSKGKDLFLQGWCSWCISYSIHELDTSNTLRRNYYKCLQCSNRTLQCFNCNNFSRGGATWNDNLCAICFGEDKRNAKVFSWEGLKEKRDAICRQSRNIDRVKAELERTSIYREKAIKQGVIRPFLLLVSMPAMLRNNITCQLGWCLFTKEYFGDSHAESFHILNDSKSGMQARANQSYERLNPLSNNCNWYDILIRVINTAFSYDLDHECYAISQMACNKSNSPLIHDVEKKLLLILAKKMKTHQKKQKDKKSIQPPSSPSLFESLPKEEPFPVEILNNDKINNKDKDTKDNIDNIPKEEEFPEYLFDFEDENQQIQQQNVSKEERDLAIAALNTVARRANDLTKRRKKACESLSSSNLTDKDISIVQETDSLIEANNELVELDEDVEDIDETIVYIKKMIVKNTGIQREEIGEYGVQLGLAVCGVNKLSVTLLCLKAGVTAIPATAGVLVPVISTLGLLTTPLMIIGVIGLTTGLIKLGFGSSEGRLLLPVISIVNQRLLLAIEDINIDDYY